VVAPEEPFEVLVIGDETGYPFLETVDTVLSGVFQKFDGEEKFHNHEK